VLERILEAAAHHRRTVGHNNYTALAELWNQVRRETMTSELFPINPFREGSKISTVFNFLADGERHSITAITDAAYFPGAGQRALYRRRVASAIRTIRQNRFNVGYRKGDGYQMTRTAAAVGSLPSSVL
jgi:hypothetical protein